VIVFASLKRSSSKLSSYQEKIFKMENKIGVAVSGLTADGSSIIDFIRSEVKKHAFLYDSTIEGERLVNLLAKKTQVRDWNIALLIETSYFREIHNDLHIDLLELELF
jgi:20S proteasome subunit alpha 6